MKQIWQRLWVLADERARGAFEEFAYAEQHERPTNELVDLWDEYDRWYKVRDYINGRLIATR